MDSEPCEACDHWLSACSPYEACCDDCTHGANWPPREQHKRANKKWRVERGGTRRPLPTGTSSSNNGYAPGWVAMNPTTEVGKVCSSWEEAMAWAHEQATIDAICANPFRDWHSVVGELTRRANA